MKKYIIAIILITAGVHFAGAQKKYKADWSSLNERPVPEWFTNAKFGIFIHWGVYSVPAWSPKGTYSEWYQEKLKSDPRVLEHHNKVYGPHFSYYQFGDMFTADLYNPKEWAEFFKKSGAKYIVPTSKHHDGYCLWPSKEANKSFGFPWNSADVGSKRDLLGELAEAVRAEGLKMGFYYSLYEWYNPLWLTDKKKYVKEHMFPQFKDVVNTYKPSIIFSDGEWDLPAEEWHSAKLIAWLFNESEAPKDVVINDRWGKDRRHKDGGYYTTEYETGLDLEHPWEENRGIGYSFGYNRNEDAQDYNTGQALTLLLIDCVSRGGNFLLDIGPDRFGKIPPIMQERLLQIGKWLDKNGEAIYSTRKWEKSFQWSETGVQDYEPVKNEANRVSGDFILQQTIKPEKGNAVKEIFFTRKDNDLFAIVPLWPGKELVVRDLNLDDSSEITLLATKEKLNWKNSGDDLVISMPLFDPKNFTEEDYYAFAFKITNVKK